MFKPLPLKKPDADHPETMARNASRTGDEGDFSVSTRTRLTLALWLFAVLGLGASARADLDEFIKQDDPSFAWKSLGTRELPAGKAYQLSLTSQTWQGAPWTHHLQIFEPTEVKYPDVMLLFITGGNNRDKTPEMFRNAEEGFALAKACGARVAILPQVPNQPLLGDKVEDDLIAETFVRHLATKDDTLPLLQPMVKSAVRAMDAVQAWAKVEGKPVPKGFVVSGASKRGWTTWLTAAVDPRVMGIAPMVIPTLNMKAQNKHQIATWGKYSEQIDDYVRRGLMEDLDQPERTKLWKLIDPFTYVDRLTMPKLQINGTNDPYWTLDSMNLYWNDLKGPSHVVYLPNAVHNLKEHRDWAVNGVGALFRHVATGKELPAFSWKKDLAGENEGYRMSLDYKGASPQPKAIRFWSAKSDSKEFRPSRWEAGDPIPLAQCPDDGRLQASGGTAEGYSAVFADLIFEIDGLEYHLSSQIFLFGPKGKMP